MPDTPAQEKPEREVLLTGATGYVGGQLLDALLARGVRVRCMVRREAELDPRCTLVHGDVLRPETLGPALHAIDTAYYMVHAMGGDGDFEARDREAATAFAQAAAEQRVRRIIYLGGLGDDSDSLSTHLRSRHEVGRLLAASGVETIELRAGVVIGGGSLSFEMIRALAERLPMMIMPRWVRTETQPIGISDLLDYLCDAADLPPAKSRIIEIGGADTTSYEGLIREYIAQRGLKRWLLPVPILSPYLSGLWLGLVTPLQARVGRALVSSLRNTTVVRDPAARTLFAVQPRGYAAAIAEALRSDIGPPNTRVFVRRTLIDAPASQLFAWHERADALQRTIPPWEKFRILRATGRITPGNRVEIQLRLGPIPLHWEAEHTDYEHGHQFADVQLRGPFVYWKHWHRAIPQGDMQSILEDRVHYALPLGSLGAWLAGRFVERRLARTFEYRHAVTKRDVEAESPS